MILIFGPQGSGKGTQAELLASEKGWHWLSTGKMFRETEDTEIRAVLNSGELVSDVLTNRMLEVELAKIPSGDQVILDGYPRNQSQAEWLLGLLPKYHQTLDCVLLLSVADDELMMRFKARGRDDDTPDAISRRLQIYRDSTAPIVGFYRRKNVPVLEINGNGSIEKVHERVQTAAGSCLPK